jgi:hypothetical protein
VVGTACRIESVSTEAACPVCSAPAHYEVQSAAIPNEMVQTVVTRNVRLDLVGSEREGSDRIPNAMVQTVVTPNEGSERGDSEREGSDLVSERDGSERVGSERWDSERDGRSSLSGRDGLDGGSLLGSLRGASVRCGCSLRCGGASLRCDGARCGELQLWQAAHYAVEVHSSESEPRFAAPIELVQFLHEIASAFT